MGFTLIGPWKFPCKAIVVPHIGITWGLHWSGHDWSIHETAHMKHCLATPWYYMGFTLVGPWNCTWKATVFQHIGIAWGLHWSTNETAHVKTLSYHTLELHGSTLVGPRSFPCKTTVLPLIGIAWGSHWLAHETAHVKPLVCHSLVLSEAHIGRPIKLPI